VTHPLLYSCLCYIANYHVPTSVGQVRVFQPGSRTRFSSMGGGGPKTHHKKPGHRPELMKTQGQLDPVEEKN
jgi:hypothetical protein